MDKHEKFQNYLILIEGSKKAHYPDALKMIDEAIKMFPKSPMAYLAKAELLNNYGMWDKSIEILNKAEKLAHHKSSVFQLKYLAYKNLNRPKEAIEYCDKTVQSKRLELQKEINKYKLEKAVLLFNLGRYNEALKEYESVAKDKGVFNAFDYYMQGLNYFALKRLAEAEKTLNKANDMKDGFFSNKGFKTAGEPSLVIAGIRLIQERFKEALKLLDEAEKKGLMPDSPWRPFPNYYKIKRIREVRKNQVLKKVPLPQSLAEIQKEWEDLKKWNFQKEKEETNKINQKKQEDFDNQWLDERIEKLSIDFNKRFGNLSFEEKRDWVDLIEETKRKLIEEDDPILTMKEREAKQILWEEEGWDMYLPKSNS